MNAVDNVSSPARLDLGRAPVWMVGLAVAAGAIYVLSHGSGSAEGQAAAEISARLKPIGQVALAPAKPQADAAARPEAAPSESEPAATDSQPAPQPKASEALKAEPAAAPAQAQATETAARAEPGQPEVDTASTAPAEAQQAATPAQQPRYWYPRPAYQQIYPPQPYPYHPGYPPYPHQPAAPAYQQ